MFFLLAACVEQATPPPVQIPDIVLVNAHVVTMDDADTVVEAVAIAGQRIIAVGTTADIREMATGRTEVVDAAGNTVSPGIIDTHNHFAWGALGEFSAIDIEYPNVTSIRDIREKIEAHAQSLEPGEWIIAVNWDGAKFAEQRDILASDLDDVAPDNPVWLNELVVAFNENVEKLNRLMFSEQDYAVIGRRL